MNCIAPSCKIKTSWPSMVVCSVSDRPGAMGYSGRASVTPDAHVVALSVSGARGTRQLAGVPGAVRVLRREWRADPFGRPDRHRRPSCLRDRVRDRAQGTGPKGTPTSLCPPAALAAPGERGRPISKRIACNRTRQRATVADRVNSPPRRSPDGRRHRPLSTPASPCRRRAARAPCGSRPGRRRSLPRRTAPAARGTVRGARWGARGTGGSSDRRPARG